MTIAELKAIDSRLKRVAAGESLGEIYRHEYDPNKSRCHSVDRVALFNALYDPTPIDEAWLEELGIAEGENHVFSCGRFRWEWSVAWGQVAIWVNGEMWPRRSFAKDRPRG